ncbi:hypothetical protein [Streptomyces scopuliridis]|uniref:hypothetical protein n=1 Tax=Streptomyces scopuliridis TaxID=452529 RepID=UPI0036CBE58C
MNTSTPVVSASNQQTYGPYRSMTAVATACRVGQQGCGLQHGEGADDEPHRLVRRAGEPEVAGDAELVAGHQLVEHRVRQLRVGDAARQDHLVRALVRRRDGKAEPRRRPVQVTGHGLLLQEPIQRYRVKDGRRIGRLPAKQQQEEAAAALNRVKTPRKARTAQVAADDSAASSAAPIPAQGIKAAVRDANEGSLNPVKSEITVESPVGVPALPWDNPLWFDQQLRKHMSREDRDKLVWLLQADEE